MDVLTVSVVVSFASLILLSFFRITESAFIRIQSDFLESIQLPKPSDYRVEQYVDKPASVLVSFSLMKYILMAVFTLSFFIGGRWFLPELNLVQRFLFIAVAFPVIIWVFGELIPVFFNRCNEIKLFKASFIVVVPIVQLINLFRFALPFSFARHEKRIPRKDMISMSDISDAIENSEVEDEEIMEKQLIKGVIKFGDLEVKEIMRSRIDVAAVHAAQSFEEVVSNILEAGYSRYPVYGTGLDDIKGILYLKDVLPAVQRSEKQYNWQQHLRTAFFVPENMKISQLLVEFQTRKVHMAVIVDEYGGTSGIATLEDILEEIVGEINDEHDVESDETLARKIGDNIFVFDAKYPIHDLIRFAEIDDDFFDEFEGEVETLGGIILSVNGNFPEKNQHIVYRNIEFIILSMHKHRIGNVKVIIYDSEKND
ncbi:MAG: hypothetical protein CVU11_06785 [Bacteroidetes bacterium HGW-Bacteroidetes-6]|jgi:gliding motility-associated protein GldE|nr:MAG: hypothetical protein CVU11_06785 [Bacteroidetes bacterium HGW-Bacteroidetes-6]